MTVQFGSRPFTLNLCVMTGSNQLMTVPRSLIKKAQIFTRDLSAEEGRDYFTADNDLGLLSFGPAEVYKEIKIRIAHQRTILTRKFKVELGNNEGPGQT